MRIPFILATALSLTFVLTSCFKKSVKPSDNVTVESRQLSGFSKLDVSDAMEVYITMNQQEDVVIEANENLHEYILSDVVGGTLKLRLKSNVRVKSGATIKIYVSALYMEAMNISGASRVELLNDLITTSLDLDVSGASSLQGGITVDECDFRISGASRVELWGQTNNAKLKLSGASDFRDFTFTVNNYLNIDLSGASKAELTANGTMDIEASGASTFNYKGDALIDALNLSGASSVNKK